MTNKSKAYEFSFNREKLKVIFEKYSDLSTLELNIKKKLQGEISELLTSSWGFFPEDFVGQHIFTAQKIHVVRFNTKCIGFCALSIKKILGLEIHYIEFLVIDKKFQNSGIGSYLFFTSIREEIFKKIFSIILGQSLEVVFITPNIRTLSHMARFASFIYPNPYLANNEGKIAPADEKTWIIANELLRNSDNPERELDREGLVLKKSYVNTPWLIYNNDTAPWHDDPKINLFAKKYLGYVTGDDREFIVRARINFLSFIRYIIYA